MPVIARFYGMIVKMYFLGKEHNPPHVHVLYGECMGVIDIQTAEMLEGDLPSKALSKMCIRDRDLPCCKVDLDC